jgi:CHAT domain-containing protein
VASAGSELGRDLLGPFADLARPSRRLIVAADGALNQIAVAALSLPGDSRSAERAPLLGERELVFVPSSTLLAQFRRGPAPRKNIPSAGRDLLAFAGRIRPGGAILPGARREAEWLHRHFADSELEVADRRGASVGPERLARYDVLHLATHTTVDEERPWRSGMLLPSPGDSAGDPYLRADRIAGLRLPARLVVLSGCESAGGAAQPGEGVSGFAAAFLSAGVPAVVATLWPVDDRTAALLMERFYQGLLDGSTAAAALRRAQLDVARRAGTAHPVHWAGFVLVGDGDATVALRLRVPWAWSLGTLAASLGLVWALLGRRTRTTVSRPAGAPAPAGDRP